jgi:pilus assembly protein FimV
MEKWPSQGTADLIEAFVFRKPGSPDESFDLPAYQELLLLYAVARDLSEYTGPWALPVPVPASSIARRHDSGAPVHQEAAPMPYLPEGQDAASAGQPAPARNMPPLEMDLAELDRTAFETLRAPIEPRPEQKTVSMDPDDPHVIDFDPSVPDTEQGDLRLRHLGVKR